MGIFEITMISVGLAMDAVTVSICKGFTIKEKLYKKSAIIALYFGIFQAIMPLIGYLLGASFSKLIESIDHWIAFVLLSIIGSKMAIDYTKGDVDNKNNSTDFKTMLPLAIATSIDALVIGVTLAFLQVNILYSVVIIGIVTFFMSYVGTFIGNKFGHKFKNKAELIGGIILIFIGFRILVEHLVFLET